MNIVVFASGTGTNAKNIFELAKEHPELLSVKALICNRKQAGVLDVAQEYCIPAFVCPVVRTGDRLQTRLAHEQRIAETLDRIDFDYICLAGYMRIFTGSFITRYPHPVWPVSKIINIHPALLPAFKGASGYDDAYKYGVKISGVTTHFVNEEVDAGLILHQRSFPRKTGDSLDVFKKRGLTQEYICYQETLLALAQETYQLQESPFQLELNISEDI